MNFIDAIKKWFTFNNCIHDFEIEYTSYIDRSFNMQTPAVNYTAVCNKCGKFVGPRYIYSSTPSKEMIVTALNKGHIPGKPLNL